MASDSPAASNYFLGEEMTKLCLKGCRRFLGGKRVKDIPERTAWAKA